MGFAAGFLLGGYEFMRSTANTLFKNAYGKENLPFIMTLIPFGLLGFLYLYGRLLSRFGPRKALNLTSLLSALAILGGYAGVRSGFKPAAGFLFILRDCYIVLVLEQYWSFMVSTLKTDAAKKFNGLFCGIASLGSILGAMGCEHLSIPLGTAQMLIFSSLSIFPAAFLADRAYKRFGEPAPTTGAPGTAGMASSSDHLGFSLFRSQRMLVFLLLIILATQVVATVLDLSFQGLLQDSIPDPDQQNAFSGKFFAWLNAAAAFGQFVLAPILLRCFSLTALHLLIPLVHIATCGYLWVYPSLYSAGVAFLLFKAVDYSVFRAAKEILYIPLSFDIRYRAKEIIDVFGYRFGKGGTSLAITSAQKAGMVLSEKFFSLVALGGVFVWFLFIIPIIRQYQRIRENPESRTV